MATTGLPTAPDVWRWLETVPDPEIPVVSLVDLGIIRDVEIADDAVVVTVTPTYSGCPATSVISLDIEARLKSEGVDKLRIERRLSPPWTTDWISQEGRLKLRAYGIAPPIDGTNADGFARRRAGALLGDNFVVACPKCNSNETTKISQFGSTPCKAHYRCKTCLEPFDYFKCI
ncbi:MAG: phenylacetate-CoA oxygenase subunit PaaJ [Hyphomicrobiales bacterium]|nr:phenylacetate-CoA oxygenase subunit PaaJ [Hyphomicrobiales bacterium]